MLQDNLKATFVLEAIRPKLILISNTRSMPGYTANSMSDRKQGGLERWLGAPALLLARTVPS